MSSYLLLPGAWHGAWMFDPVVATLRAAGHDAEAITLRGVGDGADPAQVTLATHVEQVVEHLDRTGARDLVVAGHSYAGMVLTGVLARRPEGVAAAVYLDAFVPGPGQSLFELASEQFRVHCLQSAKADGRTVRPISPDPDPRCTPHPLACFLQADDAVPTVFSDAVRAGTRLWYAHFTGWAPSPFGPVAGRLAGDPAWSVRSSDLPHNPVPHRPAALVDLLTSVV
jgi:pimeloyl-ACP methyl ester carboxylesterase